MAELKHILKEVEFRQNFVGEGFLKPPEGSFTRVNIFGEISSLQEFTEENVYLFYEFSLPIGWKVDNENEYYIIYKAENLEEENINKLKSISQISESCVEEFSGYETKNVKTKYFTGGQQFEEQNSNKHNLCLPFELELLCHDYVLKKSNPKILIQVNSVDSYSRHRIEGYCFVNIPMETGFYQIEVPCYKPRDDNYMKVFSFFLGGSRKIPDLKELAKSCSKDEKNVDTVLNRYGISTEYSGKVNINLNVVIQSKQILQLSRTLVKEKQSREAFLIKSNIDSQLDNVNENLDNTEFDTNVNLMRTNNHGTINRFSK